MKRIFPLIMCVLLIITTPLSVAAAVPKIVDSANLLTDAEAAELEQRATDIANLYGIDVVIVTVNSLDGKGSEQFADDYFDNNGYGIGPAYSGVLLLLSMEYRDWAISTCGDAIYAITDYGIQYTFSQIAGYLSQGDYYLAFSLYLDTLNSLFEDYASGNPVYGYYGEYDGPGTYYPGTHEDTIHSEQPRDLAWYLQRIGLGLIIGIVTALIALGIMRSNMNTARSQKGASSYLLPGTYQLQLQRDIFLYSQFSKVRKSENNSSSGGSSVHRSSSGRSHGGGHGKF